MRSLAKLLFAVASILPAIAHADTPPSVWDRARSPKIAEDYDLHRMVRQRIDSTRGLPPMAALPFRQLALERLKAEGAETSKNPLLRFDLGFAYFEMNDHPRAAAVLKAAIAEFPNDDRIDEAWLVLAFACGHIGDHVCERDSYREVLRRETEERGRATPLLNLAETQMHLGNLREAIEGYREALRLAASRDNSEVTVALATWGLAIALDRSGDRKAAEQEARSALERSARFPGLLRSDGVFFVPAYEVHWYEGLGWAARARIATDKREALRLWREAETAFTEYVTAAENAKRRRGAAGLKTVEEEWLVLAKARLADAAAERDRAEKTAPKGPPPKPGRDIDL